MNFLAHAYLSADDNMIMLGNLIADHVKGKASSKYEDKILMGIKLHHLIDEYTDNHQVFRRSCQRIKAEYKKYASVVIDMFYDHFLAANWNSFSSQALKHFSSHCYMLLMHYHTLLPPKTKRILPYMIKYDWLASYAKLDFLARSLEGISRRTSFDSGIEKSINALKENYYEFEKDFFDFYPEIQAYVKKQHSNIIQTS